MQIVTAYGLGPTPASPSAGQLLRAPSGLAPADRDFWRSPAFGMLLLALIFLYFTTRIL